MDNDHEFCQFFTYKRKCGQPLKDAPKTSINSSPSSAGSSASVSSSASLVSTSMCKRHKYIMKSFEIVKNPKDVSCSTSRDLKVIPRSKSFLEQLYINLDIEYTDNVDVYFPGGLIEEGNISHENYIELTIDNTRFYYIPDRKQKNAKNLKIILKEYCTNEPFIYFKDTDTYYCRECYEKYGKKDAYNFPHLNLFEND